MNPSLSISRQELIAQKIVEFLSHQNEPQPESAILSAISGRRKDKIEVIRVLRAQSLIAFTGSGRKGDPFLYFLVLPTQSGREVAVDEKPQVALEPEQDHETAPPFKTYKLPNGNVLSLSREEFDEVVELFRFLLHHDNAKSQTEKETSEPRET